MSTPDPELYAPPADVRDPNHPVNPDDPNDKIRAEGPEVADPSQQAAHDTFVASGGALRAEANNLDAAAAIKSGEGDVEGAAKLSEEAAKKREEADKMSEEARTAPKAKAEVKPDPEKQPAAHKS